MAWIWTLVFFGMAFGDSGPGVVPGLVTFVLAAVLTTAVVSLVRWRRRAREAEVSAFLVADLRQRVLLGPQGNALAPLGQCRAVKAMLISSSAPSVQVRWPGGKREVYRGSIAGGGVADVLSALHQLGFSR